MAYNVAANLRQTRPGAAFLDARDNVAKNALAERQMAGSEQAQQFSQQNALFNQQRLAAADKTAAQELSKEQEKQMLTQSYAQAQRILAAPPGQRRAVADALFDDEDRAELASQGIDYNTLDDDGIAQVASKLENQIGAALGIGPAAQYEKVEGPRGSVIQRDARTGELKQVVGADNTESPNYGQSRAPSGYTFGPDGRSLVAIPGGPADPNTPSTKDDSRTFAKADKLRDEFNAQSKEFITVGDSYNVVQEVARNPDAAGDLSMIFAFMKMLDPNSVVREQEFANAQNAAGVPDRIRNQYNKVVSGERLNPQQRAEFIGQAKNLFNARKARQDVITKRYSEMAKRNGVNPDDVVGDLSVIMGEAPAAPAKEAQVPAGVAIRNTSKSGKPIVSRDGGKTWEYE